MFGLNDPRETRETAIFYEVRVMVILTGVFFCLFRVRFSLRFRRTTAHWTEFYDCRATVRRPDGSYVAPRPNRQRFTRRRRLSESVRFYSIKREVGISTRPCRRVYIVRPTTLCLTDGERKKKKPIRGNVLFVICMFFIFFYFFIIFVMVRLHRHGGGGGGGVESLIVGHGEQKRFYTIRCVERVCPYCVVRERQVQR